MKASYAFQFYRDGRLPGAHFCERYCPDWKPKTAQWLTGLDGRAWLILIDEEVYPMRDFLETIGFEATERARLRGVRVWELDGTFIPPPKPQYRGRRPVNDETDEDRNER
jgi:hypothetical protein